MPRKQADDQGDEIEYNDIVIPRTIGEDTEQDYDDLALSDDDQNDDRDDHRPDEGDPRYEALQEQMRGLENMMQQQGQFYQSAFAQLMANGRGTAQASAGEDTGAFNLEDLPDPVEDRAGFNKELQKRVTGFVDKQVSATRSQMQTGNLEQQLTNQFHRDHPDLAKKGALFRAAVTEEANVLAASGVNAAQSIAANPDAFLDKVAARMNNELDIDPDDDNGDVDAEGRSRRPRRQASNGGSSSRSRNLGKPSRPRRRGGAPGKQPAKPKGFIAELRQQQADMGLL